MNNFIIAAAQTKPIKGNIEANIQDHIAYINDAAERGTNVVIFPELSLTGFEPELALDLAMRVKDEKLGVLEKLSIKHDIAIITGAPLENTKGKPFIG